MIDPVWILVGLLAVILADAFADIRAFARMFMSLAITQFAADPRT